MLKVCTKDASEKDNPETAVLTSNHEKHEQQLELISRQTS